MNIATALALVAAAVNLTVGVVAWSIRRAAGWETARVAAAIAVGAGLYNICSLLLALDGLDTTVYLLAARTAYLVAALVCAGWVVLAHMPNGATTPQWSAPVKAYVLGALGAAVVLAVTGLHVEPAISVIEIPWANVRYHYALTTPIGDLYAVLILGLLVTALWRMIERIRAGEPALTAYVAGFGVFVACAVDEVLVANRVITFLSLADVGFLSAVVPLAIQMVRRLIANANRLAELSSRLENEVEVRTRERDDARAALAESERLAALGRLAAGVGHEINNPLTYMQFALSELQEGLATVAVPPRVATAARQLREGAARIQNAVDGLRSHAARADAEAPIDVLEVVRAALRVARPQLRAGAELRSELGPAPVVVGSEPQLVQAVVNLVVNAGQAIETAGSAGAVLVSTGTTEDGRAFVSVADDGPGIAAEHLARLFEPYYTTNASRGGLGLGLFIARGIVDRHGGRIDVTSSIGHGTTFTITLPAAPRDSLRPPVTSPLSSPSTEAMPPARDAASAPVASAGSLLLIDDDDLVRDVLRVALASRWQVTAVADAREALALLETSGFDAIVCDLMMPGMTGIEFHELLAERRPELLPRTLYLTGGAIEPSAERFLAGPGIRHLVKPVSRQALNAAIASLVREAEAAAPSA